MGWFNNCVSLKLPFLTHLPPTITLCHVCSRESSCDTSRSAQTPPPPHHLKTHIIKTHSFNIRIEIRTFEYNSNIWIQFEIQIQAFESETKALSTLQSKGWKGTNKSYKTCQKYFIEFFLTVTSPTLIKYHPLP